MFIHISFIHTCISIIIGCQVVARWSHQVPQLQPPPGCQHYQHGRHASPSQVMMEAAVGRGWSEKSSTLLETCWRLVSFLIKLEVQKSSRFSKAKPEEKLESCKQTSLASLQVISSGFKFETRKTSQNCSPTWAACRWHRHGQAPGRKAAGWQRAKVCHEYRDNHFGRPIYNFSKCKRTI